MVPGYDEDELVEFLYHVQGARCAWCGDELDPDGRSMRLARDANRRGKWQLHHHPSESAREATFGDNWRMILPEIALNMRLVCLECHDYPHGGRIQARPLDPII